MRKELLQEDAFRAQSYRESITVFMDEVECFLEEQELNYGTVTAIIGEKLFVRNLVAVGFLCDRSRMPYLGTMNCCMCRCSRLGAHFSEHVLFCHVLRHSLIRS